MFCAFQGRTEFTSIQAPSLREGQKRACWGSDGQQPAAVSQVQAASALEPEPTVLLYTEILRSSTLHILVAQATPI